MEELRAGLYAVLVEYLRVKGLLRLTPFDAAPCERATLDDLDFEEVSRFVDLARRVRGFRLAGTARPEEVLTHLDLVDGDVPANAAVLLFGKAPQRFLLSSEIRCAHFHGTEVEKPIPSQQTYQGTAFQLVDQAVDFVLGKIDRIIGTRANGPRAPRLYEIPPEVVTEAIVNAVAHRDYADNGSVQVMLFSDRLEVRNPGRLPPPLTFDELRGPHRSIPGNPLLARPLYLADYIERMGTGTLDLIRRCVAAGSPEPQFSLTDGFVTTVRRLPPNQRMAARLGSEDLTSEVQPESGAAVQPEPGAAGQPESEPALIGKSLFHMDLDATLQPESEPPSPARVGKSGAARVRLPGAVGEAIGSGVSGYSSSSEVGPGPAVQGGSVRRLGAENGLRAPQRGRPPAAGRGTARTDDPRSASQPSAAVPAHRRRPRPVETAGTRESDALTALATPPHSPLDLVPPGFPMHREKSGVSIARRASADDLRRRLTAAGDLPGVLWTRGLLAGAGPH